MFFRHCDQRFFFEFVRDKHIIEKHADEDPEYKEKNYICEAADCEKAFSTHALLRTHRSRAHGEYGVPYPMLHSACIDNIYQSYGIQ